MAKVTAPALSFGARGTIADTMTFSVWRGVNYVRQRVIPANPQTASQQLTRTTFALLREMWKLAPALMRAPWDAFAAGRKFTGMNKLVGENLRVLRGDANMNDFIGSPGARGGIGFDTLGAVAGVGSGEIDVTLTAPSLPAGWTITRAVAMAFPDQDPSLIFGGPIAVGEDLTDPYAITLTGLGSAVSCQVSGWFEYVKPNGEVAYSVGLTTQSLTAV